VSTTTTTKKPRLTSYKLCKPKPSAYHVIENVFDNNFRKHIDNFIQTTQLEAKRFEHVIKWISFDKFENEEIVAGGGFGKVYKAKMEKWSYLLLVYGPNSLNI
jgi:hypothetical protein